mmetsp:Transcript_32440/g.70843  ORF Transcript_32440/g.70843 Transcript_32440/m.70843 type:complete len:270 (+) Transcript_32440:1546-2355(+)
MPHATSASAAHHGRARGDLRGSGMPHGAIEGGRPAANPLQVDGGAQRVRRAMGLPPPPARCTDDHEHRAARRALPAGADPRGGGGGDAAAPLHHWQVHPQAGQDRGHLPAHVRRRRRELPEARRGAQGGARHRALRGLLAAGSGQVEVRGDGDAGVDARGAEGPRGSRQGAHRPLGDRRDPRRHRLRLRRPLGLLLLRRLHLRPRVRGEETNIAQDGHAGGDDQVPPREALPRLPDHAGHVHDDVRAGHRHVLLRAARGHRARAHRRHR